MHILCLFIGLISILNENRIRALFGQWVPKDLTVNQGILVFWLSLERYTVAIISISGIHFLVPLEAELFDLIEVNSFLLNWINTHVLNNWLISLLLLISIYLINLSYSWIKDECLSILLLLIIFLLLISWINIIYDLSLNSYSSWNISNDFFCLYQTARVGTTYDNWTGVVDTFDWHKASNRATSLRFEELYTFFISLIGLVSLTINLFWWGFIGLSFIYANKLTLSYNMIGIGLRLADHLILSLSLAYLNVGFVSLRILLKIPGEFFFW